LNTSSDKKLPKIPVNVKERVF